MPKTIKNVWDSHFTFDKFVEAHERASLGKHSKREVLLFEMNLETNISNLMKQIETNKYHSGKYRVFTIYEPKQRVIKSLPYVDRVVHQWYVEEFIKPYMMPRFITHTYACLPERGGHKAVDDLQRMMRIMKRNYGNYYVLKCDISGYFYNINRHILYDIMKRKIQDEKLLHFTKTLIFDGGEEKGIPIGNYTSQFFANIYLNELDHFVKEKLQVRFYLRYMDDFILLCKTKEEARDYLEILQKFVKEKLDLDFNRKSKYYPNRLGVDFCGYITYETHRKVRKRSKAAMRKRIKKWNKAYLAGTLDFKKVQEGWNSWLGHISHANCYNLMNRYKEKMIFLDKLEELDHDDLN